MQMDARFNSESEAYTQFIRTGFPPPSDISIEGIRQRAEKLHEKINEKLIGKFKGQEIEKIIKINGDIKIPVTIYTPVNVNKDKMVVFFHGGGWTVNSRKTHQTIVNMLADATKSIWISVEYRLSPENKFPIWLDDGCEVTRQILANKTSYGGDENTKVGVAGDSAGGLISAAICQTLKNLDFQILICGQYEFYHDAPSRKEFDKPIYVIITSMLDWFASNAFSNESDKLNPRVALLRKNTINTTIPPCLFIVPELDPLRDDSYKYQEILEKAGVKTRLVLIKGAIHPFFSIPATFLLQMDPRLGDEARNYSLFISQNFPVPKPFTLQAMRERSENVNRKANEKLIGTFNGIEEERQIKIDDDTEIPITIYTPANANKDKMVVFFHGGGWTQGSRKTHQTIVNMLADATKSIWISVEYRLSPENKFPIWLDDGCEVTRQILANKTSYGGDENTKVGVAGDSAGGLIAASVCHTIKNLAFQILVYGAFDFAYGTESCKEFTSPEHILTPAILAWFSSNALRNEEDKKNPRASVLLHESFEGLPPCLFIVAELDPLRDDSYEYQKKLEKAGVKTKLVLIKDVIHAYFSLPGIYEKACGQTIEAVTEFMNSL
ncbi:unnamed protein product [Adineta steineri]|uniref:Alpha/beta hydrolase fold-3 domain-containing protein n=2 Tax=Adineta steineri TaxID=433720 RepID=A0A818WL09_9BILA|nr:unnamed protein product [Adineta steineri]